MEICILNHSNSRSNMSKANVKTASSNSFFNSLFVKATYFNSAESNNIEEIKNALKKAGMSNREADKINSLKDLKDKVDPDKLLSILLSITNKSFPSIKIKAFKPDSLDGVSKELFVAINENLKMDEKKSQNQLSDEELKSNSTETKAVTSDDILSKMQSELEFILKNYAKSLKSQKKDNQNSIKVIATNLKDIYSEEIIKSVPEEVKAALKEEGMSDEEINKIVEQIKPNIDFDSQKYANVTDKAQLRNKLVKQLLYGDIEVADEIINTSILYKYIPPKPYFSLVQNIRLNIDSGTNSFRDIVTNLNNMNEEERKSLPKEIKAVLNELDITDEGMNKVLELIKSRINSDIQKYVNIKDEAELGFVLKDYIKDLNSSKEASINSLKAITTSLNSGATAEIIKSISEEVKAALKEEGMSDKEISKIVEQIRSNISSNPQNYGNVTDEVQLKNKLIKELVHGDIELTEEVLNRATLYGYNVKKSYPSLKKDLKSNKEDMNSFKDITTNLNVNAKEEIKSVAKGVTNELKEVKTALKESGMSDEELDKINSLEDLKDKVDPDKLLSILLSITDESFTKVDLSNIKDKIKEQIDANIHSNSEKYVNVKDEIQLKNKLIDELFEKVSNDTNGEKITNTKAFGMESRTSNISSELTAVKNENFKVNLKFDENLNIAEKNHQLQLVDVNKSDIVDTKAIVNDDILSKVQSELNAALKDCLKNLKSNSEDTGKLKFIDINFNGKIAEKLVKSVTDEDKTSDNSSVLNSNGSKGEEGFLKNLLSDDNDKISRVTNFMSQFNSIKLANNSVKHLEKVVINKHTIATDMIKALKYMQINDMKDLVVKINPKELGEVVIKITMESSTMKAAISATNKEAYNLLNSNLVDITSKLQNTDIKIQDVSLSLYNDDTTFFKSGSDQNRSRREQKGKKAQAIGAIGEEENRIDSQAEADSNVDILA